jgi:hypothetical protein
METSKTLSAQVVLRGNSLYTIVTMPSTSNLDKSYRVDVTNGRCDCPAWKFSKGHTKVCKHLQALGFKQRVAA